MRSLLAGPALPAVAAVAFTACGETTIDAENQEEFIRDVVVREVGARVASVNCPDDVERRGGDTFRCTVTGPDGSTGDVIVTQQEDSKVRVVAPFLHAAEAETVIAGGIADRLEADDIDVFCPEIIAVRKDRRFTCAATAAGTSRTVAVRLTDDNGRFSYRLR